MSHPSNCSVVGIAFLAVGLVACSPEKAPQSDDDDTAAAQAAQPSNSDQTTDEGITENKPARPAPAKVDSAAVKQETPKKVFDLFRKGDRLVLSGRIRSELQAQDIAAALAIEGLVLENKLEVDPTTPGIDWGNRVDEILPRLTVIPDLHFHVEEGVITVAGTVKSEQEKNQWQRDIAYWMESPLIKELKNELKIDEGGKE